MNCKVCGGKLELVAGTGMTYVMHEDDEANCSIGTIEIYHTNPKTVEAAYHMLSGEVPVPRSAAGWS